MSEEWDFYQLLVDDAPASIFVDLGLRHSAPLAGYEKMGYLRINMQAPRPDGLSSEEEFDRLLEIEDYVCEKLSTEDHTLYVGRNTSDGNRDLYFYTKNTDAFNHSIRDTIDHFATYRFETDTREDQAWDTYFGFLYPSPPDYQRMLNRRVCGQLQQHNDMMDVPRKIDHMAVLKTKSAADIFAKYLKSEGFEVARIHKSGLFSKSRNVEFFRTDAPENIDSIVLPVFQKLTEIDGEYDGWGCSIVSDNDG